MKYVTTAKMKYQLYLDESGDHGLTSLNQEFPVFLLCGVLISTIDYGEITNSMNLIKREFWGSKDVIFQSRDIRKCEKEFSVLFDLDVKKEFYQRLNRVLSKSDYMVISSAIQKDKYIRKFGFLSNDVYELALSIIVERTVLYLSTVDTTENELEIIIEKRGKREDKKLQEHFQRLLSRGTAFVTAEKLKRFNTTIKFQSKQNNINGLQLADLIAYPLARYVMEPNRANPAFDIIQPKIYKRNGKIYGLKIYP